MRTYLALFLAIVGPVLIIWALLGTRPLLASITWAGAGVLGLIGGFLLFAAGGVASFFGLVLMSIGVGLIYLSVRLYQKRRTHPQAA